MSNKQRLIERTQLKRSGYRILGKPEEKEESDEEQRQREMEVWEPLKKTHDVSANFLEHQRAFLWQESTFPQGTSKGRDTKSYDEEIFDDDDFYHQLLRELIQRKTSDISDPIALSR